MRFKPDSDTESDAGKATVADRADRAFMRQNDGNRPERRSH
jgi:hypothetical protein